MPEKKNRSRSADIEIGFVLNYQPYACYDAAPRVMSSLLRDGVPESRCKILTSGGGHFWVSHDGEQLSTADLSNLRSTPIVNDRCHELVAEAKKHVHDDDPTFKEYIFDTSEKFRQREEDFLNDVIKNYRK